jgi:N-methylhydantoinase B
VLDDVLDGFCSPGDALNVYGVVLDLDAEVVDLDRTYRKRLELEAMA